MPAWKPGCKCGGRGAYARACMFVKGGRCGVNAMRGGGRVGPRLVAPPSLPRTQIPNGGPLRADPPQALCPWTTSLCVTSRGSATACPPWTCAASRGSISGYVRQVSAACPPLLPPPPLPCQPPSTPPCARPPGMLLCVRMLSGAGKERHSAGVLASSCHQGGRLPARRAYATPSPHSPPPPSLTACWGCSRVLWQNRGARGHLVHPAILLNTRCCGLLVCLLTCLVPAYRQVSDGDGRCRCERWDSARA